MSEKSVYQWRRTWRTGGREALRSRGLSATTAGSLGPYLQAKLAMWLDEGPTAHGWLDDQVWTAARVRALIGRKFHLSYSVSGVTRLLHRMGYSGQMPARPAAERDEDAITAWREATWREVKPSGRRSAKVAVVKYAWSGRERLGLLRVRDDVIVLHQMLWPDEIRDPAQLAPEPVELTAEEIDEAALLIDRMGLEGFRGRYADALKRAEQAFAQFNCGAFMSRSSGLGDRMDLW